MQQTTRDIRAYDLSKLSVLVVDGNKYMLMLLNEILRQFRVRDIKTATDGADALKLLKTFDADVIITEWMMQPIDGIEFTQMVRRNSDSANQYIPIIMVTGHTEYARVVDAQSQGINEFLAKPVSAASLYSRIVNVIERPRRFVRSKKFVGPDRRRRSPTKSNYKGKLRRKADRESSSKR